MPRENKNERARPRWYRRWFGAIQPKTRPAVIPIEKYQATKHARRVDPDPVPPAPAVRRCA